MLRESLVVFERDEFPETILQNLGGIGVIQKSVLFDLMILRLAELVFCKRDGRVDVRVHESLRFFTESQETDRSLRLLPDL